MVRFISLSHISIQNELSSCRRSPESSSIEIHESCKDCSSPRYLGATHQIAHSMRESSFLTFARASSLLGLVETQRNGIPKERKSILRCILLWELVYSKVYVKLWFYKIISLKSSFFPSFLHSWIAFFIANNPISEAKRRRGEISFPIFSWMNNSSSVRISSSFHHSRSSPVIDTQAVATIDIYPSKENLASVSPSNPRNTSTTSAQTRFASL